MTLVMYHPERDELLLWQEGTRRTEDSIGVVVYLDSPISKEDWAGYGYIVIGVL